MAVVNCFPDPARAGSDKESIGFLPGYGKSHYSSPLAGGSDLAVMEKVKEIIR